MSDWMDLVFCFFDFLIVKLIGTLIFVTWIFWNAARRENQYLVLGFGGIGYMATFDNFPQSRVQYIA